MKVITKPLLVAVPPVVCASAQAGSPPGLGQVSIELPMMNMLPGALVVYRRVNGRRIWAPAKSGQARASASETIATAKALQTRRVAGVLAMTMTLVVRPGLPCDGDSQRPLPAAMGPWSHVT